MMMLRRHVVIIAIYVLVACNSGCEMKTQDQMRIETEVLNNPVTEKERNDLKSP